MSAQMQALLSQLRHRLAKTTNMELECMLAQAKSAVPYSKHAPSSERLAYLALLSQLSHSHLQRGRADCGVPETRSTLLQRGVPLRQQPPAVSRDDHRWNRIMLNRWKALHQGASPDEVARKIQALRAQWNSMNDAERAGEVQALPARWNQDEGDAPAGGAHEPYGGFGADDGGVRDASDDIFDFGSQEEPVRPDVLRDFLQQDDEQASRQGVADRANAARRRALSHLLVCDQGDIPDGRRFQIRPSCQELHPGICAWIDRDIYSSALKLARNFEVYFDKAKLHKFACLSDPRHDAANRQQPWYIYFTRIRARRPHSQATHVFVACVVHPDPGSIYVSLEQRGLGLWRFQTVWDLAKAALRSRYKQLRVQMMNSSPVGKGSFLLGGCRGSGEDARLLWPGALKQHRPPADGPPIDDGADRVKKSGRRTAGIKVQLPSVALDGELGVDAGAEADLREEYGFGAEFEREGSDEEEEDSYLDVPWRHSMCGVVEGQLPPTPPRPPCLPIHSCIPNSLKETDLCPPTPPHPHPISSHPEIAVG